jgi:hypothetical protein
MKGPALRALLGDGPLLSRGPSMDFFFYFRGSTYQVFNVRAPVRKHILLAALPGPAERLFQNGPTSFPSPKVTVKGIILSFSYSRSKGIVGFDTHSYRVERRLLSISPSFTFRVDCFSRVVRVHTHTPLLGTGCVLFVVGSVISFVRQQRCQTHRHLCSSPTPALSQALTLALYCPSLPAPRATLLSHSLPCSASVPSGGSTPRPARTRRPRHGHRPPPRGGGASVSRIARAREREGAGGGGIFPGPASIPYHHHTHLLASLSKADNQGRLPASGTGAQNPEPHFHVSSVTLSLPPSLSG